MDIKPPVFQNSQADGSSFFWEGKNSDTAILLFHGFTATTVEVRSIAKFFNEMGYSVAAPLLPGHGTSPEDLNSTRYSDWINTGEKAYNDLHSKYENVFVLGESMGGLVSLWLSIIHPEITGLMLFAPALKIPHLWQSHFAWPFVKFTYKKNIDLTSPWQGYNVVPLHAASQLHQFQQKVSSNLGKCKSPMIIFQGKLDQTINPISSVEVLEKAGSVEKQLVWLEESTHCILLDKQIEEVQELCLSFINTCNESK